ncbi:MAG: hypothetical protein HQM08_25415 [Candidatus Riflebacteria bacterium]|nr:hypothetical protein [Candidatus Riflebacteria bacterium]
MARFFQFSEFVFFQQLLFSIPLLIFPAFIYSKKCLPKDGEILEFLDRYTSSGGMVISYETPGFHEWGKKLGDLKFPEPSLKFGIKKSLILTLSVCFGLISGFFPISGVIDFNRNRIEIGNELKGLKEKVSTFQEAEVIQASEAQKLLERVEELGKNSIESDSSSVLEAFDHLEQSVAKAGKEGAQKKLSELKRSLEAQAVLDSKLQNAESENFKLPEGFPGLEKMLERASGTIEPGIPGTSVSGLSKNDLASLSERLDQETERALKKMLKLSQKYYFDSETIEKLKSLKSKQIDLKGKKIIPASGSFTLCDKEAGKEGKEASEAMLFSNPTHEGNSDKPGSGGIDRGRGDAQLHLGTPSSDEGKKFKDQPLPPVADQSLDKSNFIGFAMSAPEKNKEKVVSLSSNLNTSGKGDWLALTRSILPKHRRVIKEYFKRD